MLKREEDKPQNERKYVKPCICKKICIQNKEFLKLNDKNTDNLPKK